MKTSHFHRASAIRQQSRAGQSVPALAARFVLDEDIVEHIISARTREGAAKVLDDLESHAIVRHFLLVDGMIVDFTNVIRTVYE